MPRTCRLSIEMLDMSSTRSPVSEQRMPEQRTAPGKRWRRGVLLAIGLASSAFFLWLVFRDADLDAVWRALRGADVALVLLAVVVIQFVYIAQAARWRRIAGHARAHRAPLLRARAGRARGERRPSPSDRRPAPGQVARDLRRDPHRPRLRLGLSRPRVRRAHARRRADPVTPLHRRAQRGWRGSRSAASSCSGSSCSSSSRRSPTCRSGRARRREQRSLGRRLLRDTIDELASPIGRRTILTALGLSVVAWGIWASTAGIVCRSLGIHLSPVELVFVTAVINLGVVIPSSPGFIGTYQWLAVSALERRRRPR